MGIGQRLVVSLGRLPLYRPIREALTTSGRMVDLERPLSLAGKDWES